MDTMLGELSIGEFRQWIAYYDLEPWGDERDAYRFASVVKMLHDINVRPGHRRKPLADFVVEFTEREAVDHRSESHQNRMKMIGAMIAGAHKR